MNIKKMEQKREFKGIWIPKGIWLNEEISITEKVFLAEIDSFEKANGCFASNRYFGEFFKMSKSRASQIITGLSDKGLVNITFVYDGNSKGIKSRSIKINWRRLRDKG